MARRYLLAESTKIHCAEDVLPLLSDIRNKSQEHFVSITLNGANEVIQKRIVTVGLLDRSMVHPRDVFADVITDRAAAVIFGHNHPSGDLQPSDEDIGTQDRLIQAAKILGIRVLDHLIVSRKGYSALKNQVSSVLDAVMTWMLFAMLAGGGNRLGAVQQIKTRSSGGQIVQSPAPTISARQCRRDSTGHRVGVAAL